MTKKMQPEISFVHTLVIGSGAAGLNAAVQLKNNGIDDVLIVTEGLEKGTSINTGSDKQTYYKLSLYGEDADAPRIMAHNYYEGGSMHGDLALVEAALSPRAFLHLVNLGVPFPRDAYGQFVGYKTDHDPRQRATSIGPYTSREMCRALIRDVNRKGIAVREETYAVALIVTGGAGSDRRCAGAVVMDKDGRMEIICADNTVFATGGPGGIYKTSVYPEVHTGAIGLALAAGAAAQGLPESQYGLASIAFRWNVSGTYMQVIPRFISTAQDGQSDPREFMADFFESVGEMNSNVFLKGYQWPFDSRKVTGGSSIVDILVYIETVLKGRRVFLDFRQNPAGFDFEDLSAEAHEYLQKSEACFGTPIERLLKMNPGAVELYRDHGIDITAEMLEVAVCAQHNNGGLAANHWWESVNIKHLFPVGEVNGSHGVYRPGGSALNSGQAGSFRAAEYIANCYRESTLDRAAAEAAGRAALEEINAWLERSADAAKEPAEDRTEFQARMSRAGAHIRSLADIDKAVEEAWEHVRGIDREGLRCKRSLAREALCNRQLCFAHAVYLDAIAYALKSGVGSRGSAIVLDQAGKRIHPRLSAEWAILPEDESFREQVMETLPLGIGRVEHRWVARRPIPEADAWFETAWARYREGAIYA